jgi:protein SCO1/2
MKFNLTASTAMVALCLCGGPLSAEQANTPASDMRAMPATALTPATENIPGTSLYQLPATLETAEGATLKLSELRGQPLIVTMFYSHCTSVCPLLTAQLQRLIAELSPAERQQIRVLMVSFDSVRDTPEELKAFKSEHRIEDSNWFVSRASAADVRSLAAALGIRYRELPDHSFNHSALISVADRGGTVRARTSELTGPDAPFIQAVRKQIAQR